MDIILIQLPGTGSGMQQTSPEEGHVMLAFTMSGDTHVALHSPPSGLQGSEIYS